MSDRSFILNLLFEKHCTPSEVVRLEKVNELLLDLTNRTYKRTASLARKVLSIPREELNNDHNLDGVSIFNHLNEKYAEYIIEKEAKKRTRR